MTSKYNFQEDLSSLINILPLRIQRFLKDTEELESLIEVVLDLGRLPEVRFPNDQLPIPGIHLRQQCDKRPSDKVCAAHGTPGITRT